MIVFKNFWKILNKNKITVIIYTIMLLIFGVSNISNSEKNMGFVDTKPDILIVNNDENKGITQDLVKYLSANANIIDIDNDEEKINDALFYRDVSYVMYIPQNYSKDFMDGKNPQIDIKSTGDYEASFAEMILSRYIKVANIYQNSIKGEYELVDKVNETLLIDTKTQITSKLDTNKLSRTTLYYNFASYSILACLILIISIILSSFNEEKIKKRITISSTNYKKHNMLLLISNCCFSLFLWMLYVIISIVILKDVMLTKVRDNICTKFNYFNNLCNYNSIFYRKYCEQ